MSEYYDSLGYDESRREYWRQFEFEGATLDAQERFTRDHL